MSWLLIGLDESMMTHQYLLKCPHCGALAYFHKSISCTMHGGGDPFTHGYWTDLEYDASLTGSIFRGFNRRTLPITRCRVCNRFYQKRNAEEHDSFDVRNSSKQSANPLVEFLSAQEMYEAISERTYTSPKEEAELRQLAWKIANDSARNQLQEKISQVKRTSLTFKNAHITNEQLDLYIVARSLIASWLEDSECQRFFAVIPGSGDDALL